MKYFRPKLFIIIGILFFIGFFFPQQTHASVALYGSLTDMTLDPSQTYIVDGQVIFSSNVTLTIPAGTHVLFNANAQLRVYGKLVAKGTADNHIVIAGATAPFVPQSNALAVHMLTVAPPEDTASAEVASPAISVSNDESPQVIAPTVNNGIMMGDSFVPARHAGFLFPDGSTATLSYVDISDGTYGMIVDRGSTVTVDHAAFSNCTSGILGTDGTLKLTNSSFVTNAHPVDWDWHGTFTHSNNTFSNNDINAWVLGGGISSGDSMKLDSVDGDYYLPSADVPKGASIVFSPGVTLFVKDRAQSTLSIEGTLTASGTANKPITIHGDGTCVSHSPVFAFIQATAAVMGHVSFQDLCAGITATQSTITMTNDAFDTIAGPAVVADTMSIVNASDITMNDAYQAFDIHGASALNLSNATLTIMNGVLPSLNIHEESSFVANTVSITTASTCIGIANNSSITAKNVSLASCNTVGLLSNPNDDGPSDIRLTDSKITKSGTAMRLSRANVVDVSNDQFYGNTIGISLSDMATTTLINNWWGTSLGPTIDGKAYDQEGNPYGDSIVTSNVQEVVYQPWTNMPSGIGHNPIIIVPGITGSYLSKGYDDKSELWPNITKMALSPTDSFLNDLELQSDGTPNGAKPIAVGDIVRSVASMDIFKTMVMVLGNTAGYVEGTNLFVLPYDWRLSNTENQALLKDAIAKALAKSGKTKVNIVSHSMGGLLVKDYLANNPNAPC